MGFQSLETIKMPTILPFFTLALLLSWSCIEAQNAALCRGSANGIFMNPNSRTCRSFIRCTNGIGVFQRCRRGTVFNGQQCIPGNQRTCNRVNANNFNNPAPFGGFGAGNPNPWGPGVVAQPGVWGSGVQPLPGAWNGQLPNRWGFGGQGNLGNPWNNAAPPQWNNGAFGGAGQVGGFNPGLLATWVDGNWNPESTEEGDQPVKNVNNNIPPRGLVWPDVNTGINRTTLARRPNWP